MPAIATSSAFPKLSEPLGLFGGTFDPVHFGHLRLAEESIAHLGLGGVRWIPSGQPPHRDKPQVTAGQRLEMVRLAPASNARFSLDPSEVESAAPSYTVHTLERLRRELGADKSLVLLVGADAFAGLASWHRWREIFALANVAVSHQSGFPVEVSSLPHELATEFSERRQVDISATQIRKLLANQLSARYLLPDSVLDYIQTHSLYRNS